MEAISTLVNIKDTMVQLILEPAGVPEDVYVPLLQRVNPATGWRLSKRELAPLILDGLEARQECQEVVRRIIEIAAHWDSFHLAHDEFVARATVQKAREVLGVMESLEAQEAAQRHLDRQEGIARRERERRQMLHKESQLLLMMFDDLAQSEDHQQRGYSLQDLLGRVCVLHEIPVVRSFTRNEGAEQIDGAFRIEGWTYLVECRWRKKPADTRDLDGLQGQLRRSGKQTMGMFLSIEGWSKKVTPLLKQNPSKSIILMDGYDLRTVLSEELDLRDCILAKVMKLNLEAEPYLGIGEYLRRR